MKFNLFISILGSFVLLISCSPSTDQLYDKADALIDQKKYAKAIKVYDRILKRNPKLQDAYYNKGFCYLQDSNYSKALYFFNLVLEKKGVNNGTNFIFEMNSDSPFATEEDRHQVILDELYYQIGITKYNMDSLTASYNNFQRCINSLYKKGDCFSWQGLIWVKADSVDNACLLFRKAKEFGDTFADTLIKEYCTNKLDK